MCEKNANLTIQESKNNFFYQNGSVIVHHFLYYIEKLPLYFDFLPYFIPGCLLLLTKKIEKHQFISSKSNNHFSCIGLEDSEDPIHKLLIVIYDKNQMLISGCCSLFQISFMIKGFSNYKL